MSMVVYGLADQAMDVVNLKISKVGGLTKARNIRDLCVSLGIALTIEDSWGGDIVTAAIAHLAHSTPPGYLFSSTDFNSYVTVSIAEVLRKETRGGLLPLSCLVWESSQGGTCLAILFSPFPEHRRNSTRRARHNGQSIATRFCQASPYEWTVGPAPCLLSPQSPNHRALPSPFRSLFRLQCVLPVRKRQARMSGGIGTGFQSARPGKKLRMPPE